MSTYLSVVTSWAIRSFGNSGARSSGPTGSFVPGCSTGGGGLGRSASRLYHWRGSSDSSRRILVGSAMRATVDPLPRGKRPCVAGRRSAAGAGGEEFAGVVEGLVAEFGARLLHVVPHRRVGRDPVV